MKKYIPHILGAIFVLVIIGAWMLIAHLVKKPSETQDCIGNPYNESPKHWIGIDPNIASDELLCDLTCNSYEIVKAKYSKKK